MSGANLSANPAAEGAITRAARILSLWIHRRD